MLMASGLRRTNMKILIGLDVSTHSVGSHGRPTLEEIFLGVVRGERRES